MPTVCATVTRFHMPACKIKRLKSVVHTSWCMVKSIFLLMVLCLSLYKIFCVTCYDLFIHSWVAYSVVCRISDYTIGKRFFSPKNYARKIKKILESMQQLPATAVSSSASTEESLPVRREIGDILIHSMAHQRHEKFYTCYCARRLSDTLAGGKVLAIKRPLPAKRILHATNDLHCWVSNPCIKYLWHNTVCIKYCT